MRQVAIIALALGPFVAISSNGCAGGLRQGGETSDLQRSPCADRKLPVTAEQLVQFRVDDARARAGGVHEASLRWTVDEELYRDERSGAGDRPSGYEEHTTVQLRVELGDPVFLDAYDAVAGGEGACPDRVSLPVTLGVSTADGAVIAGELHGELELFTDRDPYLTARAPLSSVAGGLTVDYRTDVDAERTWVAFLRLFPTGLRGELAPDFDLARPIRATFPDDGCPRDTYPLGAEHPGPTPGGRSFADAYAEWQTAIASATPADARWLDGTAVQVHAEVGAPTLACASGDHVHPFVWFESDSRFITSDGRVDGALTEGALSAACSDDCPPDGVHAESEIWFANTNRSGLLELDGVPPAEFAMRSGIAGVDPAGSPLLMAHFGIHYARASSGAVSTRATLEVTGQPMCIAPSGSCEVDPRELGADVDCLVSPPDTQFSELCGRHLR